MLCVSNMGLYPVSIPGVGKHSSNKGQGEVFLKLITETIGGIMSGFFSHSRTGTEIKDQNMEIDHCPNVSLLH